jgi:hypothetical protein
MTDGPATNRGNERIVLARRAVACAPVVERAAFLRFQLKQDKSHVDESSSFPQHGS